MPRKPNTGGDHYYDPFPSRLRRLMRERNVRQAELSDVLGLGSRQAVAKYTDGSSSPTGDKLVALSKYFGVSTDYLLGLTENRTPNVEKRAISDYTGLNENAVETLHKYSTDDNHELNRNAINRILNSERFSGILANLTFAEKAAAAWESSKRGLVVFSGDSLMKADKQSGMVSIPGYVAEDYFLRQAEHEFSLLIQSMRKGISVSFTEWGD